MDSYLYAVEQYGSGRRAAEPAVPQPLAGPSRLVGMIELTEDDVRLALVVGSDPESVRASMVQAGWRVDRITPAAWIAPRRPGAAVTVGDGPTVCRSSADDGSGR